MIVLDFLLKSFLVLAIAGAINLLLRTTSAALRHFIWFLALISLVLVPFGSRFLPAWRVPVVPTTLARKIEARQRPVAAPKPPAIPAPVQNSTAKVPPQVASSKPAEATSPSSAVRYSQSWTWTHWVFAAWIFGGAVVITPLIIGTIGVWRMKRKAATIDSGACVNLVAQLSRELGLKRSVQLMQSNRATMPITWGFRRPVILLPVDFAGWKTDEQRAVLLHELAHVKRWDCLTQTVGWVICAVYWFNPLTWMAIRRMRVEREFACDDLVLSCGAKASDYADHLLQIARSFKSAGAISIAAIAIAKPTQLEGRLLAILDAQRRRYALSKPRIVMISAAALLLLLPLAACRTMPQSWARFARGRLNPLPPSYAPKVDYGAAKEVAYTAVADLDRDGRLDIAVSNGRTDTVSVFRNTTVTRQNTIAFAERVDLPTAGWPFGVTVIDLDGDQRPDLATPCHGGDFISIYRNISLRGILDSNSFSGPVLVPSSRAPSGVAFGDLNGDRRPDMVVANNGHGRGTSISVFENTSSRGNISFGNAIDVVTGLQPSSVAVGDIDGDGWQDIIVSHSLGQTLCVVPNFNRGGPLEWASFPQKIDFQGGGDHNTPEEVSTADFDGDGRLDILLGNSTATAGVPCFLSIFPNVSSAGQVVLAARVDIPVGDGGASCAVAGDINGDGWPDLVVGNHHKDTISLFVNRCEWGRIDASSFSAPLRLTINAGAANSSVADFDGDGRADLAVPNLSAGSLSILKGL